jgi:uncharacterized protein (TIGR00730 family)
MRVCVFCSSKLDFDASTLEICRSFGSWLGEQGHSLVYGGARVGLMGLMADAVLKAGGQVAGYLPKDLFRHEVPHLGLSKLVEVKDLFERKELMMENSDVFVILPGGVGTLDEFFEVLTWKSLHCFDKPIVIFNYQGFWDSLLAMLSDLETKKVLDKGLLNYYKTCSTLETLKESLC